MEEGRVEGSAPAAPAAFARTFPCSACGARLAFAPGTTRLRCEHCGQENEIPASGGGVEELDFDAALRALEGSAETLEAETVRCDKCGAEERLPEHHFAGRCAFCGAAVVSKSYARRQVKPQAMVPFQIDRARAQEAFRRWVKGLWLAPRELKRYAQSDAALTGTYLPFWTYDCRTQSEYVGERGEDYRTTQTLATRGAPGHGAGRTQQVVQTRWSPASGRVQDVHDDVLVMASGSLAPSLRGAAGGFDLRALIPYQPEYVSGYLAEAYAIGLREGFPVARQAIDAAIYHQVRRAIGGDRQRVHRVDTRYEDIRYKHVLLPVWMSAYRFGDRSYRFLVNGQTGEVAGESPVSWQRVSLLVIGVVLWLIFLAWFLS